MTQNEVGSGPTARPPKDPQPSVDRLEELAKRVMSGDVLLPQFQRNFVWKRSQSLELLDSIVRNYPIGSLLLWQSRQELRSETRIADLEIDLPKPDYPVNYLLDGQQRLSTISGALYWKGDDPSSVWNIAFDLRKNEFLHLDTLDDPPQHQVRMTKLADGAEFYKYYATLDNLTAPDKETLKANADNLFNRFKDYKVAVVTLGDMSLEDVAPIFERINSTGTRLTIVDLMRAATWSSDFDLVDSIDEVISNLVPKGFGGLDRKILLRVLSAAAGGGFSAESIDSLRDYDSASLKSSVEQANNAIIRAVDFLSTQIKIPGDSIVPYANQMVVLSEIFRLLPEPDASQYESIIRWFWRSASSGYFSGWNTGMMARDKEAVQSFVENHSGDIEFVSTPATKNIWKQRQFRADGAHAKALAIVLTYHRPIDILTGQLIDTGKSLAWSNAKEYHHFFPKDYLKQRGYRSSQINCLANFIMLSSGSNKKISNRAPSDYLKDVISAAGDNLGDWMSTNLVSESALEAALADDYETFIDERCQTIHEHVENLCQW